MRLMTNRRVYRAYRELDEFTDDRCECLVNRVKADLSYWSLVLTVSAALSAAWMLGAGALAPYIYEGIGFVPVSGDRRWLPAPVIDFAIVFFFVGPPSLITLLTRDLVLWLLLRRGLTRSIRLTKCRRCGYCLLGQRVDERERLTCPECGRRTTLADLGLASAAELLPPADRKDVHLTTGISADRREMDALDVTEADLRRNRPPPFVAISHQGDS